MILHNDLVLAIQLASRVLDAEVIRRVRAESHPELRPSHGYLFQVLLDQPRSIGEIAEALGVTSQAVSQTVGELERFELVERRRAPQDGRRRLVALNDRGRAAVDAGRRARAELNAELASALGRREAQATAEALADLLEARGALDTIMARRVRPLDGL